MKYLERVILETLRLYPPEPLIIRKINKDLKLVSRNLTIPAKANVVIPIFMTNRRQDQFSNPEKFDPDNFLPERVASRHVYTSIPFSSGPRSCIGQKFAMMQMKVLLSTLIRNFTIESGIAEKDFKLYSEVILKRVDGFPIKLKRRDELHE